MGRVTGVWRRLQMFCSEHEELKKMILTENGEKTPFFLCECPECKFGTYAQRITLVDYEKIDLKIEEAMFNNGIACDMTNFKFNLKRKDPQVALQAKVLEHSSKAIKVGIGAAK